MRGIPDTHGEHTAQTKYPRGVETQRGRQSKWDSGSGQHAHARAHTHMQRGQACSHCHPHRLPWEQSLCWLSCSLQHKFSRETICLVEAAGWPNFILFLFPDSSDSSSGQSSRSTVLGSTWIFPRTGTQGGCAACTVPYPVPTQRQ